MSLQVDILAMTLLSPGRRFAGSRFAFGGGRTNRSVRRDGIWKRTYLSERHRGLSSEGASLYDKRRGRKIGKVYSTYDAISEIRLARLLVTGSDWTPRASILFRIGGEIDGIQKLNASAIRRSVFAVKVLLILG